MKRLFCLFVLLLSACDAPSPEFRGVEATRVEIDGSLFSVRWIGQRAEAIRMNTEHRPEIAKIARRAEVAIERTSGCTAKYLYGDVAMIKALLDCSARPEDGRFAEWRRPRSSYTPCWGDTWAKDRRRC